jgi:photoactive yellow protein
MEQISFEGVNLAELLPRIPDSVKNSLPFGLVKLDMVGTILEYNMAEGDLTGIDPAWAVGKNFFDDVALCTKTPAFYGRFVEGVKKGFVNAVFDYTFDHRDIATRVSVRMVTVPDHLGRKNIMILVKRADKPVIVDAIAASAFSAAPPAAPAMSPAPLPMQQPAGQPPAAAALTPPIADIVAAVIAMLNQTQAQTASQAAMPAAAPAYLPPSPPPPPPAPLAAPPAPSAAPAAAAPQAGKSRHEDILKF